MTGFCCIVISQYLENIYLINIDTNSVEINDRSVVSFNEIITEFRRLYNYIFNIVVIVIVKLIIMNCTCHTLGNNSLLHHHLRFQIPPVNGNISEPARFTKARV